MIPQDVSFDPKRWILCQKSEATTGVAEPPAAGNLSLTVAGPNPFAASTTLRLSTPDPTTPVAVNVFDCRGRLLRALSDEPVAGRRVIAWDGRDDAGRGLASGVYFVRAEQGLRSAAHRVILLR